MDSAFILLVLVVLAALIFTFVNGFHDTANAIATVIATRVLKPWQAILMAAAFNFLGALTGTAVAVTIGKGLVDANEITQAAIFSALLGAIVWNVLTWYYGIPSSSSHALIGGMVGAAISQAGLAAPLWDQIVQRTILPLVVSPLVGFVGAYALMVVILNVFQRASRWAMGRIFGWAQLASSAYMAFAHGGQDSQKTMGVITLALFSYGAIAVFEVPVWVVLISALPMAAGTAAGGWRIIRTMGTRLTRLQPVHGFTAETSAATVIEIAKLLGFPLSTTHVIGATIMGVGASRGAGYVRWNVAGNIVSAWILTIPATAAIAFGTYRVLSLLGVR